MDREWLLGAWGSGVLNADSALAEIREVFPQGYLLAAMTNLADGWG